MFFGGAREFLGRGVQVCVTEYVQYALQSMHGYIFVGVVYAILAASRRQWQ